MWLQYGTISKHEYRSNFYPRWPVCSVRYMSFTLPVIDWYLYIHIHVFSLSFSSIFARLWRWKFACLEHQQAEWGINFFEPCLWWRLWMLVMNHDDYLLIHSTEWPSDCPYCLCPPLSSHFNTKRILIAEFAACLQIWYIHTNISVCSPSCTRLWIFRKPFLGWIICSSQC